MVIGNSFLSCNNLSANFSFEGKNILIVDDQKPFQVMMRGMLKTMNAHTISVAQSGEAAIHKCQELKYDIIFIDYNLGAGRNGRQLFEEIKERKLAPSSSISILVTGEAQSTMVVGALETMPDDYIVKPFSQNLLLQRVSKAWAKKQAFVPFYDCMDKEKYELALESINSIITKYPRYKGVAVKYKAEVLFQLRRYDELEVYADHILAKKRLNWALIYKAKALKEKEKYLEAIRYAKEAVLQSKFSVSAYDVITDCYLNTEEIEYAYDWVKQGIDKSPFSVSRQYKLSAVARLNKDFEASIKACNQVVDLTSSAFKKDYRHILNHIRNIIDICDMEDDTQKKRRYNQEALYALQKSKRESTAFTNFSQEEFEHVCMARLDSVNGLSYKAKKDFFEFEKKYEEQESGFPKELLADSISLMMKIGEFDKAIEYSKQIKNAGIELDDFTQRMVSEAQNSASSNIKNVKLLNQKGIEKFTEGKLEEASQLFEKSLTIAPMNTGSALNLLQVLIAMAEKSPKQKWTFLERCKAVYKIVDGMPIAVHHEKRMHDLTEKFKSLQTRK